MTAAPFEHRVSIRGLPEWLIRDYLAELGARPDADDAAAPRMAAAAWAAAWTTQRVPIAGGTTLALTQFDMVFTGERDAVASAADRFLAKAQRGGG